MRKVDELHKSVQRLVELYVNEWPENIALIPRVCGDNRKIKYNILSDSNDLINDFHGSQHMRFASVEVVDEITFCYIRTLTPPFFFEINDLINDFQARKSPARNRLISTKYLLCINQSRYFHTSYFFSSYLFMRKNFTKYILCFLYLKKGNKIKLPLIDTRMRPFTSWTYVASCPSSFFFLLYNFFFLN